MRRRLCLALTVLVALAVPLAGQTLLSLAEPLILSTRGIHSSNTGIAMNAAGESSGTVGHIYLQDRSGTKTCSAAGGCVIYWNLANGNTFADGSTNLRVGLQDVNTGTGLEDGTFDVYGDLVGGTDALTNLTLVATPMETGTKTVTHGDVLFVGMEMTARGGADSVSHDNAVQLHALAAGFPYGTRDEGSPTKQALVHLFTIEFDDGTIGWIHMAALKMNLAQAASTWTINFSSTTTPDEYAGVFRLPYNAEVSCALPVQNFGAGDFFEVVLYEDPLGTPTALDTWAITDVDNFINGGVAYPLTSPPVEIEADTDYACALRATGTTITWQYFDLTTGFEALKGVQPFSVIKMAARTDQTGAFVETQTYHLPDLVVIVSAIDTAGGGGGGGGGETSHVFASLRANTGDGARLLAPPTRTRHTRR